MQNVLEQFVSIQRSVKNLSSMSLCWTETGENLVIPWFIEVEIVGLDGALDTAYLYFNSTGQLQKNISSGTAILELTLVAWYRTLEEWTELIGRTFYVIYWLYLADLGQLATPSYGDVYSVFVNETLYRNYFEYFTNPFTPGAVSRLTSPLNSSFTPL